MSCYLLFNVVNIYTKFRVIFFCGFQMASMTSGIRCYYKFYNLKKQSNLKCKSCSRINKKLKKERE